MRTPATLACALCLMGGAVLAQDRSVNAHYPGYVPQTVPSVTRLFALGGGAFNITVTPNVVPSNEAKARAAAAAGQYCATAAGDRRARIDTVARHASTDLGSWGFSGICGGGRRVLGLRIGG